MEYSINRTIKYDVIVIGAGPGGLSAAKAAMEQGLSKAAMEQENVRKAAGDAPLRVAVLERDEVPGGILNQCVHDGFGIVRYGAQLSGPEYGEIEAAKAGEAGAEILTGHMVTEIRPLDPSDTCAASETGAGTRTPSGPGFLVTAVSRRGLVRLQSKAVVLATGCRERTRGMLSIPGTRPAGIFTAGVAQNLINRRNVMVGRRVVILGSGDIGLIMARRLTLEGAEVICVAEAMPQPSGLARNVRQCLFDYGIPLYLNTTVSNIFGKDRLTAVELARSEPAPEVKQPAGSGRAEDGGDLRPACAGQLQPGEVRRVECDTLILSVGLIPENEVAKTAGVLLNPKTGGAQTDEFLQTSVPGIFASGNARAVMDLADFVSEQGEVAGANAAAYAAGQGLQKWEKNPHNAARKGLPEENSVTCTLCPKGCQVRLALAAGSKVDPESKRLAPAAGSKVDPESKRLAPAAGSDLQWVATGNGCPRGEQFARQEMTDPQRILTTTMRIAGTSQLFPVRSDRPVPLRELQTLVRLLQKTEIDPADLTDLKRGDVLVRDLGENRANIIAEKGCEKVDGIAGPQSNGCIPSK